MKDDLEISIDVIVHATEDDSKFLDAFEGVFGLPADGFTASSAEGHHDNPIIILGTRLRGDGARNFLSMLIGRLDASQRKVLIEELERRLSGPWLYIRLSKQDLLSGRMGFAENDAVRIRIHTPVYNRKKTAEAFRILLEDAMDMQRHAAS